MASIKKFVGICEKCGNKIEHNFIEHYEVSFFNRHIKNEIVENKENYFTAVCSKCGDKVVIGYPFRYVDPKRKYDILLVRNSDPMEDEIINNVRSGDVKSGYQTRLVADGTQLAEKIQIFDSGLDDRTIEMCKVLLWGDLCEQDPQYAELTPVSCDYFRHAKDGSKYSDANLLCYAYDVGEKRETAMLVLEENYYRNIAKHLEIDFAKNPLDKFEEINKNWANKIVKFRKKRLNL